MIDDDRPIIVVPSVPLRTHGLGLGTVLVLMVGAALGGGVVGGAAASLAFGADQSPSLPLRAPVIAELASARTAPADDLIDVVRATRPAVVTVQNMRAVQRFRNGAVQMAPTSTGSGVIFDERGYIATNNHVIEGNQGLEVVFLDGRRAAATVIGFKEEFDIAILKVEGALPAVAPLADSAQLEPGMRVVAIGSPLGTEYQNTVTTGIVAGLNRTVTVPAGGFLPFFGGGQEVSVNAAPLIQTDAAINSGNSGGPLIDMSGRVVGLNTLVVRQDSNSPTVEGFGFAVPSNVVRALADEWIDGRPRPMLGVSFQAITPDIARALGLEAAGGALVSAVEAGSGAAAAGLRQNDVIVAIDGIPLDQDRGLTDLLWRYRSGDALPLTIRRGSETMELSATLGTFADSVSAGQ